MSTIRKYGVHVNLANKKWIGTIGLTIALMLACVLFVWPISDWGASLLATETLSTDSEGLNNGFVHDGKVDLSEWDFRENGQFALQDGWVVVRDQLIDPAKFVGTGCQPIDQDVQVQPISMPDVWGPAITSRIETGHGVATYCLDMLVRETEEFLALRLGTLRSISTVYAILGTTDGAQRRIETLYRNGDPVSAPRRDGSNPATPVIYLPVTDGHVKIVIQLANYVHKQGGVIDVPVVDYQGHLESRSRRDGALPTALVLVLFLTAAATFVVGRFHVDKMRYNIFALLSLASGLRVLFVSDIVWDYFPTFSLARKYDLEYLSLFLVLPAYYAFIQMLFRPGETNRMDVLIYCLTGLLGIYVLLFAPFFAPGTVTLLREPFQVLWLIIGSVTVYTVFRALMVEGRKKIDAALVLTAVVAMSGYEVLSSLALISSSMEWSQSLVLLVTLLHVRAFQTNYKEIERERDALNSNLMKMNTDLEEQAVDLRCALVQAEDSSRAKNEFLAVMSHELRTPLNAIIGFSEMMGMQIFGSMGDKRYKGYADDISASGKHLLSIVNDILDLSRIESGNDEMSEDEIDPEELGASIMRLIATQAEEASVACRFETSNDLPFLYADERKVKQILINLMGNAIKFNVVGGSVLLSITSETGQVVFSVRDTGIGMKPEDIPIALTRFRQIDNELSRKYEGLGLGLSLVQILAEQHGAKVTIESELGKGTNVTVIFPEERTRSGHLAIDSIAQ